METSLIKRFIFTALACEAKPFIAELKLKKHKELHPFAIYDNSDTVLIVTGCGKVAMAAAVAYSLAYFNASKQPILINIGIAGHRTIPVGSLFAAHKIVDVDTGKKYYPQLVSSLACLTLVIHTVSKPERDYTNNGLYDMEASGFYEIASRFSTAEFIQSFKVVSDNLQSPQENIDEHKVNRWMSAQMLPILDAIKRMEHSTTQLVSADLNIYEQAVNLWHFSDTAQHQLKSLLQRWTVLTDGAALDLKEVNHLHGKSVLAWLEKKIAAQPFKL